MTTWSTRYGRSLGPIWDTPFFGVRNSGAPMGLQKVSKICQNKWFGTFLGGPFGETNSDHVVKKRVPMQRGARFVFLWSAPMQRGARFAFDDVLPMQRGARFVFCGSAPMQRGVRFENETRQYGLEFSYFFESRMQYALVFSGFMFSPIHLHKNLRIRPYMFFSFFVFFFQ